MTWIQKEDKLAEDLLLYGARQSVSSAAIVSIRVRQSLLGPILKEKAA